MLLERIGYYVNGRVFEWVMTVTCLGIAAEIFFWPLTANAGVLHWVSPLIQGAGTGGLFIALGVSRVYGLSLNGHTVHGVKIGPWVRAISCVFCAFVWGQFVLGLIEFSVHQGFPSPGIPLWMAATLGELYIAYRALVNG